MQNCSRFIQPRDCAAHQKFVLHGTDTLRGRYAAGKLHPPEGEEAVSTTNKKSRKLDLASAKSYLSEGKLPREVGERPLVQLVCREAGSKALEADDVVHRHPVVETNHRRQNLNLRVARPARTGTQEKRPRGHKLYSKNAP